MASASLPASHVRDVWEKYMRSCLVALFLLTGVALTAAQSVVDEWIFDNEGARLEGARDHTLRSWPVDRGALQTPYFNGFTAGDAGLEFSPSFRIIAGRDGARSQTANSTNVEATPEDAGIVTYRYDTKRRRFTIRHGLGRES